MGCPEGFVKLLSVAGDKSPMKLCLNASSIALAGSGMRVGEFGDESVSGGLSESDWDFVREEGGLQVYAQALDSMWLIIAGTMVMFMQGGFFMLEAGTVSSKGTIVILFKNLLDACVGALAWWVVGFGFAYGDSVGGFIGTTGFALKDNDDYISFFFQYAFAATAATIVSGSVAERIKLEAYLCFSFIMTFCIYPVVVHWIWGTGWLSAFGPINGPLLTRSEESNGMIDFAGSGVVHMVGGFAGLVGAIMLGPRKSRFHKNDDGSLGEPRDLPGHSLILTTLGVLILWFGWYGFNAGSTLCAVDCMGTAGRVALNTTLAASSACIMAVAMSQFMHGYVKMTFCLNGVIAGLVSITAPCPVVEPWGAILIGALGTVVLVGSDVLLLNFKIDDPLQASGVHGFCGAWGLLSVAIFGTDDFVESADYPNGGISKAMQNGEQAYVQIIGILAIFSFTIVSSALVFFILDKTIGLRVNLREELDGTSELFGAPTRHSKDQQKRDQHMHHPGASVREAVTEEETSEASEQDRAGDTHFDYSRSKTNKQNAPLDNPDQGDVEEEDEVEVDKATTEEQPTSSDGASGTTNIEGSFTNPNPQEISVHGGDQFNIPGSDIEN